MLGYLFEKLSASASSTVDAVKAIGEYAYDEVASIPDAIEKGWNEGLVPSETSKEEPIEAEAVTPPKFGNRAS